MALDISWISASSDDGCVKKTSETEYQFRFLDWGFSPHRQYLTVNISFKKIWIVTYQHIKLICVLTLGQMEHLSWLLTLLIVILSSPDLRINVVI